ncbi:MAG: sensor histidine kinase [Kiritimatiellae bacterium]|nr:sensor histidine kinase [Kiritimatiellia bacterium]
MKPISALLATLACAAFVAHDVRAAETIRSIDGLKSVSMMDAAPPGVPFDITAWVVHPSKISRGHNSIYIKDDSGSTALQNRISVTNAPIRAGDLVRATGRVILERNGIYAQCLELTSLAHRNPEPPVRLTVEELLSGQHDGQFVTVRGEICDSFSDDIDNRFLYCSLKDGEKSIYMAASTNRFAMTDRDGIIGNIVEVTGIWTSGRNNIIRRHIGPFLILIGSNSLRTLKTHETDIFNAPEIADVKSLMPSEIPFLERRRITGTVLASWQGDQSLVRTDDGSIVLINLSSPPVPEAGRRIEAVGFPETDLYAVNLNNVRWRPAQGNPKPLLSPVRLPEGYKQAGGATPQQMQAAFHGHMVIVTGIIRGLPQNEGDRRLILECEGNLLPIDFSSCPDAISGLAIGCKVEVRGVWVMVADNWRPNSVFPKVKGAFVVVNAPDDLRELARPSWWTPGRLAVVIIILVLTLVVILVWNRMLKILSERRGRALCDEQMSSAISELRVEERTRLAVELHDSISQVLTGIALQIDAAIGSGIDGTTKAGGFLATARSMLASCRHELRCCIWDLRARTFEEQDLPGAIRQTLAPHIGDIPLLIRFSIPRSILSESLAHDMLRIMRELAVNAVRHGKASQIKVFGECRGNLVRFCVKDDGCGFDQSTAPGPAQGHFGLSGIRERVERRNGEMSVESSPGKGTSVTVSLRISEEERDEQ